MKLNMRTYCNEEDYWRMRHFLREVMLLNDLHQYSWHVARLDYWWWFANTDLEKFDLTQVIFLWETEIGEIAAVLNPEGKGQAYLQVHPKYRTPELEEEMIVTAEKNFKHPNREGRVRVLVFADSKDALRHEILKRRGYQKVERPETNETIHIFPLANEIQEVETPAGYTIRSLGHGLELLERCYASGLAFTKMIFTLPARTVTTQPGITTSNLRRSIVATSISSPSPVTVPSLPSAPSGSTMSRARHTLSQ